MTKDKDCPEKTNNELRSDAENADGMEKLSKQERIIRNARIIGGWKVEKQPTYEADNAGRLHTRNRRELREAGAAIDEHRAGEGREQYNAKRREEYAEAQGGEVREYRGGLSDDDRKERDRVKNLEAQARFRAKTSTSDQSAKRAERRRRAKEREAEAAELAEIARMQDAGEIS